MIDDEPVGDDELREAEALAHAIDRGTATDALPEDALQMAALIRYGGGALSPEREDAVLADVLTAADRIAARSKEPRNAPWWRWALGLAGVAIAAALVLVIVRPSEAAPTALPAPPASLIEAQLADDEEHLGDEMGRYRGAVYAALEARYGAR